MKIVKIITIIILVVFVGIQFVPTERNQSDVIPITDFILVNNVPNDIKKKLQVSCYDCHSNNTNYPWYSKIQPVAWFLDDHVKNGKDELNFSEWNLLSNRRKSSKIKSIIKQIENNKMPLSSYTFIHKNASLSGVEKQRILKYLNQLK
ncbi:heme-binding domain-containing protein [Tenacibaculum sp. AHE15PA]|uniref:heme-binding domain-containing protein n=1 Tax=unclassified Tenacibaculum TaxID=2635139 RepID=UPI001C4EE124|nr:MULTISPECIES: heme-binding domain-containing protein [unclassified Tenacibaculum]QXP73696.1 heme-binding domain-containing protein [Tenacibaculum sp. AHE14PA]QXP75937.1 heme-binding domain-containing protein [Tenacibaculum sp. AHE15PA]